MIIVKEIKANTFTKTAECTVYADTKAEVIPGATISNLPDGYTIAAGSQLYTAALDIAVMQSDGTWKWS